MGFRNRTLALYTYLHECLGMSYYVHLHILDIQELTAHPLYKYKFRPLSKLLTLLIHAYTLINILLKFGLYFRGDFENIAATLFSFLSG